MELNKKTFVELNTAANSGNKAAAWFVVLNINKQGLLNQIFDQNPKFETTFKNDIKQLDTEQLANFLAVQEKVGNLKLNKNTPLILGEDATPLGEEAVKAYKSAVEMSGNSMEAEHTIKQN